MKKVVLAFTLVFLLSATVAAQVPTSEEAAPSAEETTKPWSEEIMVKVKEGVKEIEIRPSGEAVTVQLQTEQQTQPVQILPLTKETQEIIKVEVKNIITDDTTFVSLAQTPQGNIEIKDNKISATTTLPVKASEGRISVEAKDAEETIILPSQAVEAVIEVRPSDSEKSQATVLEVELLECVAKEGPEPPDCKVIYQVETEEENKLLGIIPIKSKVSYEVNAANGKLLAEKKPWYLKILPFLFV